MKEFVKTSRTVGYLERIYRQLNADKFGGELEIPVITIQSTPRTYGHVTCGRVWRVKDSERYELNIGAGFLDRPIENVVSTLLHEMVHIYNLMHDIQDCSRGNTYHNKRFKSKAEEVGLHIEYDSRIGWSLTNPTEELIDYIISCGWTDITMARKDSVGFRPVGGDKTGSGSTDTTDKKKSSTRKYICPVCGASVRATRIVNILCGDCNKQMVEEE